MKRSDIRKKITSRQNRIDKLKLEIVELNKQNLLFSDNRQRFVESEETIKDRKSGKLASRVAKVGRVYWKEKFIDNDKPNRPLIIERNQIIQIDGEWI